MRDIATKLSAARTRLILDKPFLGALVLRLPMRAADPQWCPKTATDARAFYYNPAFIEGLSLAQTQFILAHEALHCALSHFARRQHRVKHRWDLACDFAINPLLIGEGLTPTPEALYLEEYAGLTAEEIYPCLKEDESKQTEDQHLYDADADGGDSAGGQTQREQSQQGGQGEGGGEGERPPKPDGAGDRPGEGSSGGGHGDSSPAQAGGRGSAQARANAEQEGSAHGALRPEPLSQEERERLSVQWRQRLAGAAQQALAAGKLSGQMARLVDHLLQPQLPWRVLLARYMAATARDDYNWTRPSRREGSAILPSLRSHQVDVVIALDTSGSIGPGEMAEFVSEVDALKGQVRARITLHACDAALAAAGPWLFEPWEPLQLPTALAGGGGTDFAPVFEWLEQVGRQPDLLVYFTDADGPFPPQPPPFPVVWLVKGRAPVPWGERIQLN